MPTKKEANIWEVEQKQQEVGDECAIHYLITHALKEKLINDIFFKSREKEISVF